MPQASQFKPLPEREKMLCLRISAVRRLAGLSQIEIAAKVEVTRNTIANIEAMRVPLRAGLALAICRELNVNPGWLATGVGAPIVINKQLDKLRVSPSEPSSLFSDYFERILAPAFDLLIKDSRKHYTRWESEASELLAKAESKSGPRSPETKKALRRLGNQLDAQQNFRDANKVVEKHIQGFISEQTSLTNVSGFGKHGNSVKPHLPKLLARLKKATEQRGRKSALAKFLGVPLANVSQWLAGVREPGGETTLRMLYWVEQQERK